MIPSNLGEIWETLAMVAHVFLKTIFPVLRIIRPHGCSG